MTWKTSGDGWWPWEQALGLAPAERHGGHQQHRHGAGVGPDPGLPVWDPLPNRDTAHHRSTPLAAAQKQGITPCLSREMRPPAGELLAQKPRQRVQSSRLGGPGGRRAHGYVRHPERHLRGDPLEPSSGTRIDEALVEGRRGDRPCERGLPADGPGVHGIRLAVRRPDVHDTLHDGRRRHTAATLVDQRTCPSMSRRMPARRPFP